MSKVFKVLRVEPFIHEELLKMRAMFELNTGRRMTITELIKKLIDQQPSIELTTKLKK